MDKANSGICDLQLVLQAQSGDSRAFAKIFDKFKPLFGRKAKGLFIIGADRDDVLQEMRIGLYKAIRDFKTGKNSNFRTFAEICVQRQIFSAIKYAARHKHRPLYNYRTDSEGASNKHGYNHRGLNADQHNPLQKALLKETLYGVRTRFRDLSSTEKMAFSLHMQGNSYKEIAKNMNLSLKSVDNALHRARHKLKGPS